MREFEEKEYYLKPLGPDASLAEWKEWMDADERSRRAHRAAHTRSLDHAPMPEVAQSTVRTNGVHRQQAIMGFSGSAETGWNAEPVQEANQFSAALSSVPSKRARTRRGTKSKSPGARRLANRLARRETR